MCVAAPAALHASLEDAKTVARVCRAACKKPQARNNLDIQYIMQRTMKSPLLTYHGPGVHRDLCHVVSSHTWFAAGRVGWSNGDNLPFMHAKVKAPHSHRLGPPCMLPLLQCMPAACIGHTACSRMQRQRGRHCLAHQPPTPLLARTLALFTHFLWPQVKVCALKEMQSINLPAQHKGPIYIYVSAAAGSHSGRRACMHVDAHSLCGGVCASAQTPAFALHVPLRAYVIGCIIIPF